MLGFYPPDSAERVGFDLAKIAIYYLAGWLIFRGFVPKSDSRDDANRGPKRGSHLHTV